MSIADKLTQLATIRSKIRTALTDKGVTANTHDFADFAGDIDSKLNAKTVCYRTDSWTVRYDIDNSYFRNYSYSNYDFQFLNTSGNPITYNLSSINDFLSVVKFNVTSEASSTRSLYGQRPFLYTGANRSIGGDLFDASGSYMSFSGLPAQCYEFNKWYYLVARIKNKTSQFILLDENYNIVVEGQEKTHPSFYNDTKGAYIGGNGYDSGFPSNGISFIPSDSFVMVDGNVVSGQLNQKIIDAIS